eukprot:4521069-Amphidinium_carterae.1
MRSGKGEGECEYVVSCSLVVMRVFPRMPLATGRTDCLEAPRKGPNQVLARTYAHMLSEPTLPLFLYSCSSGFDSLGNHKCGTAQRLGNIWSACTPKTSSLRLRNPDQGVRGPEQVSSRPDLTIADARTV